MWLLRRLDDSPKIEYLVHRQPSHLADGLRLSGVWVGGGRMYAHSLMAVVEYDSARVFNDGSLDESITSIVTHHTA